MDAGEETFTGNFKVRHADHGRENSQEVGLVAESQNLKPPTGYETMAQQPVNISIERTNQRDFPVSR